MIDNETELRVFVGLGGNLGDRLATMRSAVRALARDLTDTRVVAVSSIYETRPLGPSREAFFNAVAELRTGLAPTDLLEQLLTIERQHGRQRRRKWDARTLDLDMLVAEREGADGPVPVEVSSDRLQLPHPRMMERDFVLVPLAELMGVDAVVGGRTLGAWLEGMGEEARTVLRRVDEGVLGGGAGR